VAGGWKFEKRLYFCNVINNATLQHNWGVVFFFCFLNSVKNQEVIMSSVLYVSRETLEQMKEELHRMRTVDRPAAARAIAEAREKGDLKENAEYDAAKEAQGILEAKIKKLEGDVASARILDAENVDTSKVSIMTKVKLTNMKTMKQLTYQIVSEKEADLKVGKISITSPIGQGLLGKTEGEIAEVEVPAGVVKFKIESISV
jgi:transcription elongation factor GreA